MRGTVILTALALGCGYTAVPPTPCGEMCDELVSTCSYSAYPSMDSCLQGCQHEESEGRDVEGQQACVAEAECNTFAIVECEHAFE